MTTAYRPISRRLRGQATSDGAGVSLTRVIGSGQLPALDPFLMLDEFGSDRPGDYIAGFPSHPHRGFETVTYMRWRTDSFSREIECCVYRSARRRTSRNASSISRRSTGGGVRVTVRSGTKADTGLVSRSMPLLRNLVGPV